MAITAKKDWDRLTNALASGNVVSGVNTLSGNAGKDVPGVAPNKVTQIQFERDHPAGDRRAASTSLGDARHAAHQSGRQLHLHAPAGRGRRCPSPASTDVFTYTYADKNGASSTATLTIEVLPETVAVPDSKGVHKGTAFDDFHRWHRLHQDDGRRLPHDRRRRRPGPDRCHQRPTPATCSAAPATIS